jgi:phage/plasmid-associated DNA primase
MNTQNDTAPNTAAAPIAQAPIITRESLEPTAPTFLTDAAEQANKGLEALGQLIDDTHTKAAPESEPTIPISEPALKALHAKVHPHLLAEDGQYYPNEGLFAKYAPELWQHGLPVIPLLARRKEAFTIGWQNYKERMPTPQEQDHWLKNYPDCNIGLPLGPQAGCIAIDIDTDNQALIDLITQLCGPSPWTRVGSKGKVLLYKYTGQKPFKIKDVNGKMYCEMLSTGNQVVLPPSIHPTTQKPYVSNVPLVSALPYLTKLPDNIEEILRSALSEKGVMLSHLGYTRTTDYVSQGSRDVKMTSIAGLFAAGVTRGELTLLEAIERLRAWKNVCVENVAGDDIDVEKGIRNLIQFLIQDVTGPKNRPLPLGWDDGLTEEQRKNWGLDFADEHTEWSVSQLLNYLKADFEKHPEEESIQRLSSIDYVIRRISHSPSISTLEVDAIFQYIVSTNRHTVTKTSLKRRLMELTKGELEGTDHTEIAKSLLEDFLRLGPIHYYQDKLWQYRGSHWIPVDKSEFLKAIATDYGFYPAAKRASDHDGILKIIKSLVPQGDLDTARVPGVNFANCYVDVDGIMHPHDPSYGATYTLPYRYMPDAVNNHPVFDRFLASVWGHTNDFKARCRALQEAMVTTFFGLGTSFARAILLYGIAGSGKSQMLEIMKRLLPDNVVSYVTPYNFSSNFDVAELSTSLMNVCGELENKRLIPGASFKSIIDGSSLQASYKFGQTFSFSPKATHWFASNYLPKTSDASEGFNRRWLVLSFDRIVPKEEKVRDLGSIIAAEEREAIAAWAISIIREVNSQKDYTIPPSHTELMRQIACENDTVFFYLTSEEGPRRVTISITQGQAQMPVTSSQSQAKSPANANQGQTPQAKSPKTNNNRRNSPLAVNTLYEKYSSFCYATAHVKPVGLRLFLTRLQELSVLLEFEVVGLTVYGLTMDKDGEPLTRSL